MKHSSISLSHPSKLVHGKVQLTGSKSESNRALIIQALSEGKVKIENLSEAADTVTLENSLSEVTHFLANDTSSEGLTIDIGPAGTAMRFLTAYLSLQDGNYCLTGSKRMKERPIGILVDAVKNIGGTIKYTEEAGYPPLKISGPFQQTSQKVSIQGNVSSQYLSALLLIANALPQGLTLIIEGELTSKPYLMMTLEMLKEAGIEHEWTGQSIYIKPQKAKETVLNIEPDWSAASYWYSIVALAEEADILLPGLRPSSLQGDNEISDIMRSFGVFSVFTAQGLKLTKTTVQETRDHFDFKSCPDLAQTVIACCAALGREATFSGLETLKIKETDRILALQNEIAKFGVRLFEEKPEIYRLDCSKRFEPEEFTISTYDDHRMAMAFAPLALVFKSIKIEDPEVVEKSYPEFWQHLSEQGFIITQK
jgi:3-phosphoshikimate 1-carboxyvinyltransferase